MNDEKALSELIEETVDQGATTVEEIHRAIAEMPLGVLEQLGLLENTTREVRRIQDVSLGAVYGLIRDVNHKAAELAGRLIEERKPTHPGEPGR
jgi:hypothetical protein